MNSSKKVAQWRVAAASVCGTSHTKSNQLCQDAYYWHILPNNVLLIAVADGAGCANLGKAGAVIATQTAIEYISQRKDIATIIADNTLLREMLHNAIINAKTALEKEAEVSKYELSDLATTLIIVLATPKLAAVAQIGDGLAVTRDSTGKLQALTTPHRGEYVNETIFLTSSEAVTTTQIQILRHNIVNIGVLTDGLQMLALNMLVQQPHQPFFLPLFDFVTKIEDYKLAQEQLTSFLSSRKIIERTDDDLTLILAAFSS